MQLTFTRSSPSPAASVGALMGLFSMCVTTAKCARTLRNHKSRNQLIDSWLRKLKSGDQGQEGGRGRRGGRHLHHSQVRDDPGLVVVHPLDLDLVVVWVHSLDLVVVGVNPLDMVARGREYLLHCD